MDSVTGDVISPKVLIIPTETPIAQLKSPIGTLMMSGAKLYVCTAVGTYELITSS